MRRAAIVAIVICAVSAIVSGAAVFFKKFGQFVDRLYPFDDQPVPEDDPLEESDPDEQ